MEEKSPKRLDTGGKKKKKYSRGILDVTRYTLDSITPQSDIEREGKETERKYNRQERGEIVVSFNR